MTGTAFVFPGQGSARVGMGQAVLDARPELAAAYHRVAEQHLGIPLARLCRSGPARHLADPAVAQPAVLVTGLVTWELLRSRGIEPTVVAGHSLGEYAALVAAGSLRWTDALALVRLRGELVATVDDRLPGGSVAVVGLDRGQVADLCEEAAEATGELLEIGADNAPDQAVVVGRRGALDHFARRARQAGALRVAELRAGGPFHSSLLREIEAEFAEALDDTDFRDPRIPVVSSVTARPVTTAAEAVDALRRQLTSPVRWRETLLRLRSLGAERFVESGPGLVLGGLIRSIDPGARVHAGANSRQLGLTQDRLAPAAV
ncbi:ACP S-malonyltransferase [Streptomyces sp. NPDC019224]|uniref:ACP S-malonyltransferase n=1 Tax=Streptomyces sp. NPDC019224 TaxID=3154484 RepID=UPI0033E456EF